MNVAELMDRLIPLTGDYTVRVGSPNDEAHNAALSHANVIGVTVNDEKHEVVLEIDQ